MREPREQIAECAARMYATQTEESMQAVLLMCQLELGVLDRRLRVCAQAELQDLQGQVKVWEKLRKSIKDAPAVVQGS